MNNLAHTNLTGVSNTVILENITYLNSKLTPERLRIRYLVIPDISDSVQNLEEMGRFIQTLQNLEMLEFLSYGAHAAFKWRELFGSYRFENVREATNEDVERTQKIMERFVSRDRFIF
jgi:pyruvate formate lyase activating enzyme